MEATLDLTIEDIRTLRKLYIKLKQGESIFREKVLIPVSILPQLTALLVKLEDAYFQQEDN